MQTDFIKELIRDSKDDMRNIMQYRYVSKQTKQSVIINHKQREGIRIE